MPSATLANLELEAREGRLLRRDRLDQLAGPSAPPADHERVTFRQLIRVPRRFSCWFLDTPLTATGRLSRPDHGRRGDRTAGAGDVAQRPQELLFGGLATHLRGGHSSSRCRGRTNTESDGGRGLVVHLVALTDSPADAIPWARRRRGLRWVGCRLGACRRRSSERSVRLRARPSDVSSRFSAVPPVGF